MCKTHRTQKFRSPRLSWYSFGDICRPFQPSYLKNHDFQFFTKLPTKSSSYAVVHRPTWPCAKPTELKTFMHQDFHGTHLETFVGPSNPHISKITNFNFSQNTPPSHLALPWCKTHRTQNFRARRLRWYSFGDICRPFQPSHLKNHEFQFFTKLPTKPSRFAVVHRPTWPCEKPTELKTFVNQGIWKPFQSSHLKNHQFHFFTKLPTKPSSYVVVHHQPWPCAKPTELKTFVHQDFHGIHLGTFLGLSNPHISKITNFISSQNSPTSHLAMPWCTDQLGPVQNPPNSKLSCTKTFMVFIWGHL